MKEPKPTARKKGKGVILAFVLSVVAILLFALAPLLPGLLGGIIADANGCALNEAGVHPCMIGGSDYGETLHFMFMLGWFGIITLPLGASALIVRFIDLIIVVVRNIRNKKT